WGDLLIQKYGGSGTDNPLADAEFTVYLSKTDADSDTNPIETVTSDADGIAKFDGLKVGDYWVKETTAPDGWTADPDAQKVTVTAGEHESAAVTFHDTQKPSFTLPLTGSTGSKAFLIGGLVMLLAGGG